MTMFRRSEEYANIEDEHVDLLRRRLAELPTDAASLQVKRARQNGEGVIATLKPRNATSAAIITHTENGLNLVDFRFGEYGPTWELPIDTEKANKSEVLSRLQEMCQAVIAGNCKHKRGFLSVTGIIQIGNKPHKVTDVLVFRASPRLSGKRQYEPYVPVV